MDVNHNRLKYLAAQTHSVFAQYKEYLAYKNYAQAYVRGEIHP